MESWSPERVAALAPDPASAAAGQSLANVRKWSALGRSDRAIWGLCQGSGKQPYQARVDLAEPAFKCSCPSRKFPCKHGLGLLLLFAKQADAFSRGDEPGWVADWLAERVTRAAKKSEQVRSTVEKPVDLESQARRAAQREARVRDGVAGCRVWLDDLVRRGLAAAQSDPAADWERAANRLVDAQAPGLASFIRRIPMMMASGPGWDTRTVDLLGRLYLLLRAAERLDELPADLAVDVRTALGWTQAREDALASTGVADRWTAVGQVIEEEERFRAVRTWLVGRDTGRRALILEFAAGSQPLDRSLVAGSSFDGELAFYPSRQPLRALLKSRSETLPHRPQPCAGSRRDDRIRTAEICRGPRVQSLDVPLARRARRRAAGARWQSLVSRRRTGPWPATATLVRQESPVVASGFGACRIANDRRRRVGWHLCPADQRIQRTFAGVRRPDGEVGRLSGMPSPQERLRALSAAATIGTDRFGGDDAFSRHAPHGCRDARSAGPRRMASADSYRPAARLSAATIGRLRPQRRSPRWSGFSAISTPG